ncbi:hypothetical protein LTR53_018118, partial [Teratosphaeriaceae sp. CCFEE 6253]
MSEHSGPGRRASPTYEPINGPAANAKDTTRDQDPEDQDGTNGAEETNPAVAEGEEVTQTVEDRGMANDGDQPDGEGAVQSMDEQPTDHDGDTQQHDFIDEPAPRDDNEMDASDLNGTAQHDSYAYDNQQAYDQDTNNGQRAHTGFHGAASGGFRGGRGGFGGSAAMQSEALDLTPAAAPHAPPINAPSGPKAMREGRPNTGFFARTQAPPSMPPQTAPSTSVVATPQYEDNRSRPQERDDRERDYDARSRSRSKHRSHKHRDDDDRDGYESEESRRRRKDKEREKKHRNRRDRESKYDDEDGEQSSPKGRSREESRTGEYAGRHHDKDEERSHRDEKRKSRRHRSRSPEKDVEVDGDDGYRSNRKSKSEKKYDDRSHRHSRSSRDDGST